MPVFDKYARYYDLLYHDKDYRGETNFVLSLLRGHVPSDGRIFEMGCGTGIHAEMLTKAGHYVHGVDCSETMLSMAAARQESLAPELLKRLSFAQGDVRVYRADRTFDVALSLFHVFSYQTSNADLQAAFATAAAHLETGGILIFDYWYGPAVLAQRPETRVKRLQGGDLSILRIAEPCMDETKNVVEVNYETIVNEAGTIEVIRESHRMRYLFLPEVELLARLNGFVVVKHYAWMTDDEPSSSSWAACSVLKKSAGDA